MIKKKGNKVWLIADDTYTYPGRKIMRVTDNKNGYTIKSYGWGAPYPDVYWSMDYAEAADLVTCLRAFDE